MQLTVLGCGSSAGTPVVGCQCPTCLSTNPRNTRTRCSSLISLESGHQLLIDSGPDLRQQSLRENISRIDGVLYTHTHADHLHGIDDLRAFCVLQRQQIPLFGREDALEHIRSKFTYAIREPGNFWEMPVLATHVVENAFIFHGVTITPIPVMHGKIMINGYRIGNLAYITDVSLIPETSYKLLEGVEWLLIDCLRYARHPTHVNVEESLAIIERIGAKENVMIHMTHELEYEQFSAELPSNVSVGYDGMQLIFN